MFWNICINSLKWKHSLSYHYFKMYEILSLNRFIFSFGTIQKIYRGFQMFIGEPTEFPVMADRGKLVDTGHETNFDISGRHLVQF